MKFWRLLVKEAENFLVALAVAAIIACVIAIIVALFYLDHVRFVVKL